MFWCRCIWEWWVKMDKDIKKLWVDALRSGKYKQGKNLLKKEDCFCCLGVLCEISDKAPWKQAGEGSTIFRYAEEMATLPENVANWANLDRASNAVDVLIYLNDSGTPFADIADYIEEGL